MLFTNDFQWFSTTGGVRERRGDLAKQQPLYATLKKMIYNPTAEIMILLMSVHLHTNNGQRICSITVHLRQLFLW